MNGPARRIGVELGTQHAGTIVAYSQWSLGDCECCNRWSSSGTTKNTLSMLRVCGIAAFDFLKKQSSSRLVAYRACRVRASVAPVLAFSPRVSAWVAGAVCRTVAESLLELSDSTDGQACLSVEWAGSGSARDGCSAVPQSHGYCARDDPAGREASPRDCSADSALRRADDLSPACYSAGSHRDADPAALMADDHFLRAGHLEGLYPGGYWADSHWDDCRVDRPGCDRFLLEARSEGLCPGGCWADSHWDDCRADRPGCDHFLLEARSGGLCPDGCSADSHWDDCRVGRPGCDHFLLEARSEGLYPDGCWADSYRDDCWADRLGYDHF